MEGFLTDGTETYKSVHDFLQTELGINVIRCRNPEHTNITDMMNTVYEECVKNDPTFIIAHSMGGFITYKLMEQGKLVTISVNYSNPLHSLM